MSWHEKAPEAAISGANETARRANISTQSIHKADAFQKHSDSGIYCLTITIAALPTSELREMVNLLTFYGPAFGFHGRRRRDIAMRELQRRSAVR